MNQTQIAKLLFTSQTVYSRYERGVLTIPVEHLLILADFYGVSTDYIPDNALAIERGRETIKEGYAEKKLKARTEKFEAIHGKSEEK